MTSDKTRKEWNLIAFFRCKTPDNGYDEYRFQFNGSMKDRSSTTIYRQGSMTAVAINFVAEIDLYGRNIES